MHHVNPGVLFGGRIGDGPGLVPGTVIHDHHFDGQKRLPGDAVDGPLEVPRFVTGGDDDNIRPIGRFHAWFPGHP